MHRMILTVRAILFSLIFLISPAIAQEKLQLFSAQQSSTGYGGVAARAIDANTNGIWRNGSVTHTQKRVAAVGGLQTCSKANLSRK